MARGVFDWERERAVNQRRRLRNDEERICPDCGGVGTKFSNVTPTFTDKDGEKHRPKLMQHYGEETCQRCKGTGRVKKPEPVEEEQ